MKLINYNFLVKLTVLFLLISVSACSLGPVNKTRSGFDDVETLSVEPAILSVDKKMAMGLMWDETMPDKYSNVGILKLRGNLKATPATKININVDGKKYKLDVIDTDKKSTIGSHHVYMANIERTSQTDELVLVFKISDKILIDIAKSKRTVVMVNLANNLRVEDKAGWTNKKDCQFFMLEKQKNKAIYPKTSN